MQDEFQRCERCGGGAPRRYQIVSFDNLENANGELHNEREFVLCAHCARNARRQLQAEPSPAEGISRGKLPVGGVSRRELIAALDRFFAASGVFDICGRCHQQGTGCCPPTCRVMGAAGCDPANKHGKTVFCAAFVCGALLNAISECDPEAGRALKWIKRELGTAEFRVYEMITRVPAEMRETVRPLVLPKRYPRPDELNEGEAIREKLLALAEEVLEIRRRWQRQELAERPLS